MSVVVMTERTTEITDKTFEDAMISPIALASKIIDTNDPRLDELVAVLEAEMIRLNRCPCVCCERDFIDPRERAVLELLPIGDKFVRLHMCCEECLND